MITSANHDEYERLYALLAGLSSKARPDNAPIPLLSLENLTVRLTIDDEPAAVPASVPASAVPDVVELILSVEGETVKTNISVLETDSEDEPAKPAVKQRRPYRKGMKQIKEQQRKERYERRERERREREEQKERERLEREEQKRAKKTITIQPSPLTLDAAPSTILTSLIKPSMPSEEIERLIDTRCRALITELIRPTCPIQRLVQTFHDLHGTSDLCDKVLLQKFKQWVINS